MSALKLFRITLDTNPEDCNLRCIMCEEHSPYSQFKEELYKASGIRHRRMPKALIENLFKQAKELGVVEIIPSTMGEPLLYKHIDLIYQLSELYGIKINLTTNGTFPGKPLHEWFKLIIPNTTDIKVSWNGSTAETYNKVMRGGNFDKALSNLKQLINARDHHYRETGYYCRITIQLTFMAHTMHELPDIIKLAASIGVDRVKGHHLWVHFAEIKDYAIPTNPDYKKKWNTYVDEAYQAQEAYLKPDGTKVVMENIHRLEPSSEVQERQKESVCPFLGKELWISATGVISPCCAPDKLRKSLGDFGNIHQTSLREVLQSPKYVDLQLTYPDKPLCRTCNMRKTI